MAFALTRAATTTEVAVIEEALDKLGFGALATQPTALQNNLKQAIIYASSLNTDGTRPYLHNEAISQVIANYEVVADTNIT